MKIPNKEEWIFIENNLNSDPLNLLLSNKNKEIDIKLCIEQIQGRNIAKDKFPSLYKENNIIYPQKLFLEQTSSEFCARYKASLLEKDTILFDLTSGFGIDDMFFAKKIKKLYYNEKNEKLFLLAKQNFKTLNIDNVTFFCGNSLKEIENKNDITSIYIDPSRRDINRKKVFLLEDSSPNIVEIIPQLLNRANNIYVKLSPLLDISILKSKIPHIKQIHIISYKNECKELFVIINRENKENDIVYFCIDINKEGKENKFSFIEKEKQSNEQYAEDDILEKGNYLYEPFSSLMKASAFEVLSKRFNLTKLSKFSHLFISKEKIESAPCRRFIIKDIIPYNRNTIKDIAKNIDKANITIRNFPISVENIRNQTKIKEGGKIYLFFTTNKSNDKLIFICEKI
ncbi:MAG: class I SAM-dependent methyltransferase [Bacteroidales bacterium]|jgi:hypothetical protein|nr:class I SAM-dependent methyltransferase [Bacteroidales bacterium]